MQQQRIPTEAEWAWLAGLFEGEGCIRFTNRYSVHAVLNMTDRDVLETVDRLVPSPSGLKCVRKSKNPAHKDCFQWYLTDRDRVEIFLRNIQPWMHSRRGTRVKEAIERLSRCRGRYTHKPHCRNGHLWTEVGVYIAPGQNGWACPVCRREARRRFERKGREQRESGISAG